MLLLPARAEEIRAVSEKLDEKVESIEIQQGRAVLKTANRSIPLEQVKQIRFEDRKSTRLNSSHSQISYAVFCLKKKNEQAASVSTTLFTTCQRPLMCTRVRLIPEIATIPVRREPIE